MKVANSPSSNCSCQSARGRSKKAASRFSWLGTLFIALLPKCPFCLLSYSSAVTLCSGTTLYQHAPGWTSWISIAVAAITLASVLFNYKGSRTLYAAACCAGGAGLILYSELYTGYLPHYYLGAGLLFFGVWFNGSFRFFQHRFRQLVAQYF